MRAVSRLGYEREDAIVDQHVSARPGFRILELCCGTARAGRRWVARGAEVLGVDRSVGLGRDEVEAAHVGVDHKGAAAAER